MPDYRKLFDLTGKTAVVLGAASGIGKSSAEALAGLGARVVCADRDPARNEATAAGSREAGSWAEAITTDAALATDVTTLAAAAKSKFSRLDIAFTTPGLNMRKTILDYTEDDLDRVADTSSWPLWWRRVASAGGSLCEGKLHRGWVFCWSTCLDQLRAPLFHSEQQQST
jgi:NAD(P)-dependent dehydrogenase (short-subunit alcohol dehydrogenase family)